MADTFIIMAHGRMNISKTIRTKRSSHSYYLQSLLKRELSDVNVNDEQSLEQLNSNP